MHAVKDFVSSFISPKTLNVCSQALTFNSQKVLWEALSWGVLWRLLRGYYEARLFPHVQQPKHLRVGEPCSGTLGNTTLSAPPPPPPPNDTLRRGIYAVSCCSLNHKRQPEVALVSGEPSRGSTGLGPRV